jgi:hypothetical protein
MKGKKVMQKASYIDMVIKTIGNIYTYILILKSTPGSWQYFSNYYFILQKKKLVFRKAEWFVPVLHSRQEAVLSSTNEQIQHAVTSPLKTFVSSLEEGDCLGKHLESFILA